jgi:hypothetical protein
MIEIQSDHAWNVLMTALGLLSPFRKIIDFSFLDGIGKI